MISLLQILKYNRCRYQSNKNLGNLKVHAISQALPSRKGENLFIRSKFVQDTVNTWVNSSDEFITTLHTPSEKVDDHNVRTEIPHEQRMVCIKKIIIM